MKKTLRSLVAGLLGVGFMTFASSAHAFLPFSGTGSLGSYTGTMTYTDTNSTSATVQIDLTNTSPLANGGYLTALIFNNPSDLITGVTQTSAPLNFGLIGGSTFDNTINGSPNGQFDIGSSTFSSYEGGGAPSKGIGVGASGSWLFTLTGTNLDTLDEQSFFDELSVGPGDGSGDTAFEVRFRGFNNDGSDKVTGIPDPTPPGTTIPEPISMLLLGSGLGVAAIIRRKV